MEKTKKYSVWVGGIEVNDVYVGIEEARQIKAEWEYDGYTDVRIEEVV